MVSNKSKRRERFPAWFEQLNPKDREYLEEGFRKAEEEFYNLTKPYKYHLVMKNATVDDMETITKWCEENLPDCLPFPDGAMGKYKNRVFWIYFRTNEEQVLFKLRWW